MPKVGGSISLSIIKLLFALKSSQRSSDRIRVELSGAYTLHTNGYKGLTLAGMAGVVSLTSSVDMEIGGSRPFSEEATCFNGWIINIEREREREREAVIQVFFGQPDKLSSPICASEVVEG